MSCPKCLSAMESVNFRGITVDRCLQCRGIWFDGAEHRELKKVKGSADLDTGSVKVGQANNSKAGECPRCGSVLGTVPDTYQPHIHYDVCPDSHGVFFDAGEFRDFVKDDLGDFFKSLLIRRKKQ